MHKRFLFLNFMIISVFAQVMITASVDPAYIEGEMKKLKRLEISLAEGGVDGLLKTATAESLAAPKINSSYFAGRVADREPDLAPLENAKRAFGLKVATALDDMAVQALQQATSEQRIQMATSYLDLAEWLKVEKRYGNYLLVIRCENLAVVPLGYLVADLAFPMDRIAAQRNRIMSEDIQREFRKTVLNTEAPRPFIETLAGSQRQQNEQIQIAWGKQSHAATVWFKERGISIDKWNRSDLPEDLKFFLDVSPAGPKTTVKSWNMDRHEGIAINGLREKNIEYLDAFAKYRQLVGTFPTEPPGWWKPDDPISSKTRAAFQHAWRPFRSEHGPIFGSASRVYEWVQAGTWRDSESQLQQEAAKQKP